MKVLNPSSNFLGITEPHLYKYKSSKCVIQQLPYEYTSSYKTGSAKGPNCILKNSHFVEFYDPEIDTEAYKHCGISAIREVNFEGVRNEEAMHLTYLETKKHLQNDKFTVSLGAEHTITYGIFKAFKEQWDDIAILQLDAHSDLREEYVGNRWSHASVMARILEFKPSIYQVGIRAQSSEEAELIKTSDNIRTWYAHNQWENDLWIEEVVQSLPSNIYITIDTDSFDPSICPSVGTPEPGGLLWHPTLKLLRKVFEKCDVRGFDIVELNPTSDDDSTAYLMAQLCYKLIGYKFCL